MFVTVKDSDGKRIRVDVCDRDCPKKTCFGYHKYQHRAPMSVGTKTSGTDKHYSCPHRNYHGCPNDHRELIRYGFTEKYGRVTVSCNFDGRGVSARLQDRGRLFAQCLNKAYPKVSASITITREEPGERSKTLYRVSVCYKDIVSTVGYNNSGTCKAVLQAFRNFQRGFEFALQRDKIITGDTVREFFK